MSRPNRIAGPTATEAFEDALCLQVDPDLFFPDSGQSAEPAKRICRRCPVRAECLEYALRHGERFGVWGGLSERQRRMLAATDRGAGRTEDIDDDRAA